MGASAGTSPRVGVITSAPGSPAGGRAKARTYAIFPRK